MDARARARAGHSRRGAGRCHRGCGAPAAATCPSAATVVLHCSGLRDRTALAALEGRAAGLGSFHPLQTLAGDGEAAERLQAAYAVLEGDAAAVLAGRRLAGLLGMTALEIRAADKPRYHAAAVIVSNYTVALVAVAERLAAAGGDPGRGRRANLPAAAGGDVAQPRDAGHDRRADGADHAGRRGDGARAPAACSTTRRAGSTRCWDWRR